MPTFTPKEYQASALNSIELYFRTCQRMGNADYAFQETTKALWGQKSAFTPLRGFEEDMPYFVCGCRRGAGRRFWRRRVWRW